MKGLLILGAGEYGKLVKELAESAHHYDKIAFLDDRQSCAVGRLEDYSAFVQEYSCAVVAIGNAEVRLAWLDKLKTAGYRLPAIVSARAYVSPSARVAEGCVVEPFCSIATNATLSRGVLACAGSIVNHDSVVEEGCQLNCGSVVAARATVPAKTKLGYNEVYFAN